jgi:hypothetical protein
MIISSNRSAFIYQPFHRLIDDSEGPPGDLAHPQESSPNQFKSKGRQTINPQTTENDTERQTPWGRIQDRFMMAAFHSSVLPDENAMLMIVWSELMKAITVPL